MTDQATMEIVQQVLAGKVNKDLVSKLRGRGVGLCGMDGQMLRCAEMDSRLGYVGEVTHVDTTLIRSLLDGGLHPGDRHGGDGRPGPALQHQRRHGGGPDRHRPPGRKAGVHDRHRRPAAGQGRREHPHPRGGGERDRRVQSSAAWRHDPKIGGMADAIYQGVHEAVIIDGRVPHTVLLELFSNRGSGTRFYRRSHRE